MVHAVDLESTIDRPWGALARAYFQRYPNPYASHVIQVDVIDRQLIPASAPRNQWPSSRIVEQETATTSLAGPSTEDEGTDDHLVLRTSRLILKRGTLPSWAPRGVIKSTESWVLEETEVDVEPPVPWTDREFLPRKMRVWTRNLDHTNVLAITEGLTLSEPTGNAPLATEKVNGLTQEQEIISVPPQGTHVLTRGHVVSSLGFGLLRSRVEKFGLKRFKAHADTSRAGLVWAADCILGTPVAKAGYTSKRAAPEDLGGGRVATAVRRLMWRFPPVRDQVEDEDEAKWQTKLRAALRPPFLDGYPPTPLQRLRNWVWGEQGRVAQAREAEERIRWAYKARRLLGLSGSEPLSPPSREGGRGYMPLWARWHRLSSHDDEQTEEQDPLLGYDYRDQVPMPV